MVYIKYLPKDQLLYALWKHAKVAPYLLYCQDMVPKLTIKKAKHDIEIMITNKRELDLTTYYGKLIFADISGDHLDTYTYNIYNGNNLAEKIVADLKINELQNTIAKFYLFG